MNEKEKWQIETVTKIDILTKLQKFWSDFSECLEDMITAITFLCFSGMTQYQSRLLGCNAC